MQAASTFQVAKLKELSHQLLTNDVFLHFDCEQLKGWLWEFAALAGSEDQP
jgi:hypothetical protein